MDRAILTPRQQYHVSAIRFCRMLMITQPGLEVDGRTSEDMIRIILNDEFVENGLDGVALVESQSQL